MDTSVFDRGYFHGHRKSNYDNYARTKSMLFSLAKVLYASFRPGTAFDAGGAYGHLVHGLRRRGVKAWGIDISAYAVKHSPFMHIGDITQLDDQGVYDLVTCNDVLEHIPEQLIPQTMQRLWQITGQYLVAIIATEEYRDAHKDPTHVTVRSRAWWEKTFRELGLPENLHKETELNCKRLCKKMDWTGRIFVLSR